MCVCVCVCVQCILCDQGEQLIYTSFIPTTPQTHTHTHTHTHPSHSPAPADGGSCTEECTPDELAALVGEIRDRSGLICSHTYHLISYKNCFVGKELVSWLVKNKGYQSKGGSKEGGREEGRRERGCILIDAHSFITLLSFPPFIHPFLHFFLPSSLSSSLSPSLSLSLPLSLPPSIPHPS